MSDSPERTLDIANELMRQQLNKPPRDAKVDAETVSDFIQALINEKVPSDMIKDLAIAYLMRI